MATIIASSSTKMCVVLVDDADYKKLSRYTWALIRSNNNKLYAARYESGRTILMHREILDVPDEFQIDHKNNNGLDNRRDNLRIADATMNKANQSKSNGDYTSKYKGVSWRKSREVWVARITSHQGTTYLGSSSIEEEAARLYDMAAQRMFGEFAKLNFSLEGN